jgi:selenide, water dikinase
VWGRVAATNAVSDIYAMGGRPLFGLNIVGWNHAELGRDLLVDVLGGIARVAEEGGWIIGGGHSIDDPEPKVGVAVIGEVHPERILTRNGLRPGDALVLTKPLGVGVAVTALKAGAAPADVVATATACMLRSNAGAGAAAVDSGATAATDVTGFGLLGHLLTMVAGSDVDAVLAVHDIPILAGVGALVAAGHVPGGTGRNLDWVRDHLVAGAVPAALLDVLADPQTSGGLLIGTGPAAAADLVTRLRATGHDAAVIGTVERGDGMIHLR